MWYVLAGTGAVSLLAGLAAWYFYQRARADRADRDAALGRAAAAGEIAARLQNALDTAGAKAKAEYVAASQAGSSVHGAPAAADFLRDSAGPGRGGMLPADPPGPAPDHVPAAPRARGRVVVSGFGRV